MNTMKKILSLVVLQALCLVCSPAYADNATEAQTKAKASPKRIELTDGVNYTNRQVESFEELTYTRNFTNTSWQALYVPFSMSYDDWNSQGLEVAKIQYFNGDTYGKDGSFSALLTVVRVGEGQTLKPNHPYMVRSTSIGTKTITLHNATLFPAESRSIDCGTFETKFTVRGIYEEMSAESLKDLNAYGMSNGRLVRAHSSSLRAFRWYMVPEFRGSLIRNIANYIKVLVDGVEEDMEDAIENILPESDTTSAFTLMGQKVEGNAKGIVIRNGKKYLNK